MNYAESIDWLEAHAIGCPMKALTGFDCPACGMQRAVLELLRGDLVESLNYHPAAIPTCFLLIYLVLHLRFKFSKGPHVLKWTFIITAAITMINYTIKIFSYGNN